MGGDEQQCRRSVSRLLDILEGTQQIQQLIVARGLLGTTSGKPK